jgi:teichuronic acid biosynthesis glycosyltransferase TuaC
MKQTNTPFKSDKAPHVLVVSNHWKVKSNPTNGSIWVDRQVTALKKLGVQVSTFDVGTSHAPWNVFRKWKQLRHEVQRIQPDLVHARYGSMVGMVSAYSGAPSVITYAGSDLLVGAGGVSKPRVWTSILLSNLASLKATALICVSDELRRALWWRSHRAVVIPDGVDLAVFKPTSRQEARQALGWKSDEIIVLTDTMRDPVRKGLAEARSAMEIVRTHFPKARLQILQVSNPSEMPLYCSAADLLLCASRREGSPNMVKEAMACNLPVVSTPVGDVPELLAHVHPSAIAPREPRALAEAMLGLLKNPKRSNGREHSQPFNLDSIAARVLEVYQSTICRRPEQARTIAVPLEPAA